MSSSTRSTGEAALVERQPGDDEAATTEPAVDNDKAKITDPDGGFDFETETKHHDPVVRMTEAFERDEITAEVLETADTDALKTFVVRAEAGEFDVRADPALEAAVRIARSLVYEQTRE